MGKFRKNTKEYECLEHCKEFRMVDDHIEVPEDRL
jgi:hypothetical protein